MTTHASGTSRSRVRRGLSALLLLPLLLVLSGCFRLDLGLTINEDETVDVAMELADLTGLATRDDLSCDDLSREIADSPEEIDFTVEDIETDGNVGCRLTAAGGSIDAMTGEGMTIEKVEDTFVFTFDGDDTGMGDFSDMPGGMEPEVSISVTFPGDVIEADGEIDGNTVTWTGMEVFATGGTATGYAAGSGGGSGGVSTAVWVILGVVALLAIAALIFLITKKSRGSRAQAAAPYGAPYGRPGQVPADPGAGFGAQPGAAQPTGGFGPADQVPADPGPGYPGQQPPAPPAPSSTAAADAPVQRPAGSPFAPPQPPAEPDEGDQQQR